MQVHAVFTHGNPGGLIPPGGGGTIFAADVRGAVSGPEPRTMQAAIMACSSGSSTSFLSAYLWEGAPDTVNRFVVGFAKACFVQLALDFFTLFVNMQRDGWTAGEAAKIAGGVFGSEEVSSTFVRSYGDSNARMKWLFDGTPGNRTGVWKVAP
jgi:hypothetical protein